MSVRLSDEQAEAVAEALSFYGMAAQDMHPEYDYDADPSERRERERHRRLIAQVVERVGKAGEPRPVMSADDRDNATLIEQCAELGYLRADWLTLDPTYGLGVFYKRWRPDRLVAHDLNPLKAPDGVADFTALPYADATFDAVVFDPPYKLNGKPSEEDARYGVDVPERWQDRMELCERGIVECARVLKPSGHLLIKCMDQVVSNRRRFQGREFSKVAEAHGCVLHDELLNIRDPRTQPEGRRQVRSLASFSTMLVLRKRPRSGRGSRKV